MHVVSGTGVHLPVAGPWNTSGRTQGQPPARFTLTHSALRRAPSRSPGPGAPQPHASSTRGSISPGGSAVARTRSRRPGRLARQAPGCVRQLPILSFRQARDTDTTSSACRGHYRRRLAGGPKVVTECLRGRSIAAQPSCNTGCTTFKRRGHHLRSSLLGWSSIFSAQTSVTAHS